MLTAVVIVNEATEKKDPTQFIEKLNNAGLKSLEESLCDRYLTELIKAKENKVQVGLIKLHFSSVLITMTPYGLCNSP